MTAQKPRRTRRRSVPASALPRPSTVEAELAAAAADDGQATPRSATARRPVNLHHRQHHVTKDYTYVHRDLLTILGVGIVVIAFIVAMSFIVA